VSYEKMKEKVNDALKAHFRPEFLNRIDETIVFHELSKPEVTQIVDFMINRTKVNSARARSVEDGGEVLGGGGVGLDAPGGEAAAQLGDDAQVRAAARIVERGRRRGPPGSDEVDAAAGRGRPRRACAPRSSSTGPPRRARISAGGPGASRSGS
jgi:hypothetical protein